MSHNWMQIFELLLKFIEKSGILQNKKASKYSIALAFIVHLIFAECFVLFGVIHLLNVQNVNTFSESIGVIPLFVMTSIKSLHFLYNKNKVEAMLMELKQLIEKDSWIEKQNGAKLKLRIKNVATISTIFIGTGAVGLLGASTIPFLSHKLPVKMWFPYEYENSEMFFWLSALYQIIAGIYILMLMLIHLVPMIFITYLTGITEELCDRLKVITTKETKSQTLATTSKATTSKADFDSTNRTESITELLKCIEIQQKLKILTVEVADTFGVIIWLQGFMSTFVLCTVSYSLSIVSCVLLSPDHINVYVGLNTHAQKN